MANLRPFISILFIAMFLFGINNKNVHSTTTIIILTFAEFYFVYRTIFLSFRLIEWKMSRGKNGQIQDSFIPIKGFTQNCNFLLFQKVWKTFFVNIFPICWHVMHELTCNVFMKVWHANLKNQIYKKFSSSLSFFIERSSISRKNGYWK